MRLIRIVSIGLLLAAAAIFVIHCSSKDKGTTPTDKTVKMSGQLQFDNLTGIDLDQVKVSFGSNESEVDTSGKFSIKGNGHTPGVAMATDVDGKMLLMQIIPDPTEKIYMSPDARSTAEALVFLHPFVCICDPTKARQVLGSIDSLWQFMDLEVYLSNKLQVNPRILNDEDPILDSLVSRTILAYVETYPSQLSKLLGIQKPGTDSKGKSTLESPPEIQPSIELGGLKLTHEGGDKFRIWNALCRWAYCTTPTDSFFLFPSGDFLDLIKSGGTPWPPSKRDITMHVTPGGDTSRVDIYGYGFLFTESNKWHNLSMQEREWAHMGGVMTIIFELGRHTLGVITNIAVPLAGDRIAPLAKQDLSCISFFYSEINNAARLNQYISNNDPWGASYWLVKQFFSRLITSEAYRDAFCSITGTVITNQALLAIGKWVALPLKAAIAFNSVSQGFRAALGFERSYFHSSFKIWKEYTEFGGIEANVGDKQTGSPISGVLVKVIGDDNNPMHPAHEQTTDNSGFVSFSNIGTGEKSLQATKAGYNAKTVAVAVEKNKTASVDIVMERQSGGVSGKVMNEILQKNGVTPAYFKGSLDINAREIGGNHRTATSFAFDGSYSLSLPIGSWWVLASHEDYKSDSFQVSVVQEGQITAPRDLVLKPDPTCSGEVWVDKDNNGSYEYHWNITFPQVGLQKPHPNDGGCPYGGSPMMVTSGAGVRGNSNNDFDFVEIAMTVETIREAGAYDIGGNDYWGCTYVIVPATAVFGTTRIKCLYEQIVEAPMMFGYMQDPDDLGCNCGITAPGTLYLTDFGTELGDVVAGGFNIDLSGWNTCDCGRDGDGWDVSCAKARVDVNFRFLVGTDYLLTYTPGTTRGISLPLGERK